MSNMRVDASGQAAIAVTPSDTVNISHPTGQSFTKGIYIGGAGNIAVVMADGNAVTFTAIAVGVVHPISVTRVNLTNTTATGILAVY